MPQSSMNTRILNLMDDHRNRAGRLEPDPPAEPEPRRCPDCGMEIPGEWHFCPPEAKQGKAQEECDESWQRGYRLIGDPFDSLGDELP